MTMSIPPPAIPLTLEGLDLNGGVRQSPFPAKTKRVEGNVNGTSTAISSMYFSDKIMFTISQAGRLSQWIQVSLSSASPIQREAALPSGSDDLLPLANLTPTTLLGGGGDERETIGHLYASQIATLISSRDPEETRTVLVGIGLLKIDMAREAWFDTLELIQQVL